MRAYPADSPEAAARLVSMVALADGHLCSRELALLEKIGKAGLLGLSRERLHAVLRDYCQDMQLYAAYDWAEAGRLLPETLDAVLAEVRNPALRAQLLQLCAEVVDADAHWSDAERYALDKLRARWQAVAG